MTIDATTEFFTSYIEVLKYARADEVSQYGKPTDKTRCVVYCVCACVFVCVRACMRNHALIHIVTH